MSKQIIRSNFTPDEGVPAPVAPYSHTVTYGDLLFVTGQMPIDARTGALAEGGIVGQTHQVMANLKAVLKAAGTSLERTLMVRAYLSSMELFEAFNDVYATYFVGNLPARTCVSVTGMACHADLEIDLIVGVGDMDPRSSN